MILYTIETDGRSNIPIQCVLEGGLLAGGFLSSDLLTGKVRPLGAPSILFTPAIGWYTADTTQNGYDQQQIEATFTTTQAATLQQSTRYCLTCYRAPASDPTNVDVIAKFFFIAKGPSDPQ